jgi:hypothetical protein
MDFQIGKPMFNKKTNKYSPQGQEDYIFKGIKEQWDEVMKIFDLPY